MRADGDSWVVTTEINEFQNVQRSLEEQGFSPKNADMTYLPKTVISVAGNDAERLMKLLDTLEDQEDVQNVYANFEIDDQLLEKLSQ